MPLVRFLGFPDGETVSLSASQAAASDSVTLANWNVAPDLAIEVVRAPSVAQYAPEAVWFYAVPQNFNVSTPPANSVAYDPEFHEIEYVWDFGDDGDQFTAPEKLLSAHRDANAAVGMQTTHVYRRAGTYTVTCTARRIVDPDTMEIEEAVTTTQVTVGDPDTLWNAANTIVVAHDGDFTGAPPSNYQCTDWEQFDSGGTFWEQSPTHWAAKLYQFQLNQASPVRILFKRGGDYSGFDIGFSHSNLWAPYPFLFFGAWGTGAKPITGETRAFALNGAPVVWQGIHFKEDYDDLTEAGFPGFAWSSRSCGYNLLTECDFTNAGSGAGISIYGNDTPITLTLHDCKMESLAKYGVYFFGRPEDYDGNGSKDRLAVLGLRDIDSGAAPSGLGGIRGNEQGPMRVGVSEDVVVAGCDFFCRFGWTGQAAWPDGSGATAVQPAIRLAGGAPTSGTQRNGNAVVSRCAGEGGEFVSISGPADEAPSNGNILVDQNFYVGMASSQNFGNTEVGALTMRNNLYIKPNVPNSFGLGNLFAVLLTEKLVPFDEAARKAEPVRFYNNTFIVLQSSTLQNGMWMTIDLFDTYLDENNVLYVPQNPSFPRHEDITPFDTTELWSARYLGRLEQEDNGVLQTQYATPSGTVSLYRPTTGSPVIGTAMGTMAYSDLLGTPRISSQSRGALEPQ